MENRLKRLKRYKSEASSVVLTLPRPLKLARAQSKKVIRKVFFTVRG